MASGKHAAYPVHRTTEPALGWGLKHGCLRRTENQPEGCRTTLLFSPSGTVRLTLAGRGLLVQSCMSRAYGHEACRAHGQGRSVNICSHSLLVLHGAKSWTVVGWLDGHSQEESHVSWRNGLVLES